jgi:hypothetical protein
VFWILTILELPIWLCDKVELGIRWRGRLDFFDLNFGFGSDRIP